MKKSEILNEILNDIQKYASEKNNEFGIKMIEYRKNYDISQICGLVESFLKYQYTNNNIDEYVVGEIERYNSVCSMFSLEKVELNETDLSFLCSKIKTFCKVLFE